jgi:hypothetical protein
MKIEGGACVYVIYNPVTQLTKIGMTENINKRKKDLECACGVALELMYHTDYLLCAEKYEMDAHVNLHEFRALGEWFMVTPELAMDTVKLCVATATQDPVVENYKKGVSLSVLSKMFGVTRQAILSRLKSYGVYNNDGKIYEKHITPIVKRREVVVPITEPGKAWDIRDIRADDEIPLLIKEGKLASLVKSKLGDTYFLDDITPKLPLTNLKRTEPNIESNGKWYKAHVFCSSVFVTAYSKNIDKVRRFVYDIKNGCNMENLQAC